MAVILDILLFVTLCALLIAGYPVALTLAGTALVFAALGLALGVFDWTFVTFIPQRIFGTMTNEVLVAVPLFVFMGVMLERSRVAEDLLDTMGALFGGLRGGIGLSVLAVGALLAASTGIVGATVVTMGLISLPTMLRRGYSPALSSGTIAAAGTLGQIIPPSIVLILLGDVISTANQEVALDFTARAALEEKGLALREVVSVGDLFAGALLPGLLLVGLYMIYLVGVALVRPEAAPALPPEDRLTLGTGLVPRLLSALLPPIGLIVAVLGSILGGIASPTEAAAVGAVGAILLASFRVGDAGPLRRALVIGATLALVGLLVLTSVVDLRLARESLPPGDRIGIHAAFVLCGLLVAGLAVGLVRLFTLGILREVMRSTAEISSMVFVILIGAALFSLVFRGLGGDEAVQALLTGMPGGVTGAVLIVMTVMFVLGFFLDFIEITFVVVPLVAPVLIAMGVDPVWLGVMMALNLQTSFLTPPFGFALFYLRGVAPASLSTMSIYKGAVPFVLLQLLMLGLVALMPGLATGLPDRVAGP
ncbi:MAG: TRAP transporter large permease subunit [Alphaproteobacteria bacterium]|nr:TRAP transporter large permease subunit [Alphaproteobacteria bacterium]